MNTIYKSFTLTGLFFMATFSLSAAMAAQEDKPNLAPVFKARIMADDKTSARNIDKSKGELDLKAQGLPSRAGSGPVTGSHFAGGNLKADLIIKPFYQNAALPEGFPGQSFCEQALSGGAAKNIWFQVKNNGHAIAEPAQVRILFNTFVGGGASQIVNQNIPSLAMGQSQVVKVALPKGCYPAGFSSSCHFRIVVDSNYQVQEMNESNNSVDSKCVNPAG
jgi:hypothetical protein